MTDYGDLFVTRDASALVRPLERYEQGSSVLHKEARDG